MESRKICAIVQDLLPSYTDKMTKPETTAFVDAHLTDCEACRRICRAMAGEMPIAAVQAEAVVRQLKQKRRRKIVLAWGLVLLLAAAAAVCLLPWPRNISVVHEGYEWRISDASHGVLRQVRVEGTCYDYLFKPDGFDGVVEIDGHPAATRFSAELGGGEGQIAMQTITEDGMARVMGFMYMQPDGSEMLICLYEDNGWSGRDGLMLTAPASQREAAVRTANRLVEELDRGLLRKSSDFD